MADVVMQDLRFSYTDKQVVLDGVDLNVKSGSFVCFLGQSGCGKSTLLRLIGGLEDADSGILTVDGKPIKGAGLDRGVVFQDYGLFPWMSMGKNITLALEKRYPKKSKQEHKRIALEWLDRVGLDANLFDKLPGELSGGQKQRCAIARAFALDAPILLMDEPFGALDAVTKAKLQNLVLELWSQGEGERKTVFFVTHEVDEALLLASDIVVLCQVPAKIIYQHSFEGEMHPTRENMYTDEKIAALRQKLIALIHQDAVDRASKE